MKARTAFLIVLFNVIKFRLSNEFERHPLLLRIESDLYDKSRTLSAEHSKWSYFEPEKRSRRKKNLREQQDQEDKSTHLAAATVKDTAKSSWTYSKSSTMSDRTQIESDDLDCKHFLDCSGCSINSNFFTSPLVSEAESFCNSQMNLSIAPTLNAEQRNQAKFEKFMGAPHEWRTHAKLAISSSSKYGGINVGLYKAGTHKLIQIPDCRVHHPSINKVSSILSQAADKCRIIAYNEDRDEGMLRYVQMSVERETRKVQLTLIWNAENYRASSPHLQILVKELRRLAPDLIHSIWANFKTGPGNAIFSRKQQDWHRCFGKEFLVEKLVDDGPVFFFSPMVFRQSNLDQFADIVQHVTNWVPEKSVVCELYAGIGIIGLSLVLRAKEIRCSDINPANKRSFDKAKSNMPLLLSSRISYRVLSAEDALMEGDAEFATCIIVDPPRKGLDVPVLSMLCERSGPAGSLRRLIYISCGFDAFKHDCVSLLASGWKLVHSEGHILFPGSDHIETLAIFDR